jgi:hypothetical protein
LRAFAYALKLIMSCYAEVCVTVTQTQTRQDGNANEVLRAFRFARLSGVCLTVRQTQTRTQKREGRLGAQASHPTSLAADPALANADL